MRHFFILFSLSLFLLSAASAQHRFIVGGEFGNTNFRTFSANPYSAAQWSGAADLGLLASFRLTKDTTRLHQLTLQSGWITQPRSSEVNYITAPVRANTHRQTISLGIYTARRQKPSSDIAFCGGTGLYYSYTSSVTFFTQDHVALPVNYANVVTPASRMMFGYFADVQTRFYILPNGWVSLGMRLHRDLRAVDPQSGMPKLIGISSCIGFAYNIGSLFKRRDTPRRQVRQMGK